MKVEPIGKLYSNHNSIKTGKEFLPKNAASKQNLHKTFSKMILLAQIFGFWPVQGILGADIHSLNFTWKSFRVLYALFTILGSAVLTLTQLHRILLKGLDLLEANRLFFNGSGLIAGVLFLKLARNWTRFMKDWTSVELSMLSYGYPGKLNRKINILLAIFMLVALVEYVLGQSNKFVMSLHCHDTVGEAISYFLGNMSFSHIFSIVEYNAVQGIFLQIFNLQLCFIWTFNDLFVMIISTALAYRFDQITTRIQAVADAELNNAAIWKNLREDYNRVCRLCGRIDDEIADIVILTFASDLFFILVQLFNSLRHMKNDLERIYFYWSFGLLIGRTIALCLFGAKVNDESTRPMIILNSVPSSVYNLEIQRFIQQIGTSEVAITGKNFFHITRGLILSIAGAIVTYELVLIQFNDSLLKETMLGEGSCPIYV